MVLCSGCDRIAAKFEIPTSQNMRRGVPVAEFVQAEAVPVGDACRDMQQRKLQVGHVDASGYRAAKLIDGHRAAAAWSSKNRYSSFAPSERLESVRIADRAKKRGGLLLIGFGLVLVLE